MTSFESFDFPEVRWQQSKSSSHCAETLGRNVILKGMNLQKGAAIERNRQAGGHKAGE